jgi:hypothetical protein
LANGTTQVTVCQNRFGVPTNSSIVVTYEQCVIRFSSFCDYEVIFFFLRTTAGCRKSPTGRLGLEQGLYPPVRHLKITLFLKEEVCVNVSFNTF